MLILKIPLCIMYILSTERTMAMKSNIKRYRQFAGLTQNDLSQLAGIKLPTYRAKEQGRVAFNDKEKVAIKKIISDKINSYVSIDEIFFSDKVH